MRPETKENDSGGVIKSAVVLAQDGTMEVTFFVAPRSAASDSRAREDYGLRNLRTGAGCGALPPLSLVPTATSPSGRLPRLERCPAPSLASGNISTDGPPPWSSLRMRRRGRIPQ